MHYAVGRKVAVDELRDRLRTLHCRHSGCSISTKGRNDFQNLKRLNFDANATNVNHV